MAKVQKRISNFKIPMSKLWHWNFKWASLLQAGILKIEIISVWISLRLFIFMKERKIV